jgi:hypothetical protein
MKSHIAALLTLLFAVSLFALLVGLVGGEGVEKRREAREEEERLRVSLRRLGGEDRAVSEPLSREFLLACGRCCHNGCQNCPYSPDSGQHIGGSHASDDSRVEVSAGDGGRGVVEELRGRVAGGSVEAGRRPSDAVKL